MLGSHALRLPAGIWFFKLFPKAVGDDATSRRPDRRRVSNDLGSLEELAERLRRSAATTEKSHSPFQRTFTRADLEHVPERVDAHQHKSSRAQLRLAA
jgi:hypothetical protein